MICTNCGIDKQPGKFDWRRRGAKRQSICKLCRRKFDKEYYLYRRDKAKSAEFYSASRKRIYRRNKKFLVNYIEERGGCCADCGESDLVVFEWHHRNPEEKLANIGTLMFGSIRRLKNELDKCDLLCANCHKRRHV